MRHKKPGHRLSHAGYQEAGNTPLPEKHPMQTIALSKKQFLLFFCWCTRVLIHCHSAAGFLFTVTVSLLSLSAPLSSSLTVMAFELEASVEMLPKEDRELHESETSPTLSKYSTVSGRTCSLARPFPLSF